MMRMTGARKLGLAGIMAAAIGLIPLEHREGVNQGWAAEVSDIRARAERIAAKK